jgi:hypothetical protein
MKDVKYTVLYSMMQLLESFFAHRSSDVIPIDRRKYCTVQAVEFSVCLPCGHIQFYASKPYLSCSVDGFYRAAYTAHE